MKRTVTVMALALVAAGALFAATPPADVLFVDGQATVRRASGKTADLDIGDRLVAGDSVRTGKDGLVELDQKGLAIRISPNTVFALSEREVSGKPTGVLAITLGQVRVKYGKLTGQEPSIQTVSCVAGVRGTEIDIYAAADGASLFVVNEGMVTVEANGRAVDLGPLDGIVISNGQAPGDKFKVLRDQYDGRMWSSERLEKLLADPLATVNGMRERLGEYAKGVREHQALYQELGAKLKEERARMEQIASEKGKDEADAFQHDVVAPLIVRASNAFLNYRYFLLGALSMRRFIGGRAYLLLKAKYLANPGAAAWTGFLARYREFLAEFESSIAPLLVEADI